MYRPAAPGKLNLNLDKNYKKTWTMCMVRLGVYKYTNDYYYSNLYTKKEQNLGVGIFPI